MFGYGRSTSAGCCASDGRWPGPTAAEPWAAIAAAAGYADQAHLARDVRSLTGLSPTALRRERVRSVQDAA